MRASLVLILRQRALSFLNRDRIKSYLTIIRTFNDRSNRREHLVLFGAGSIYKRVRNFAILIRLFDDFKMASTQTNMAEGQEKDVSETTTTMQADRQKWKYRKYKDSKSTK